MGQSVVKRGSGTASGERDGGAASGLTPPWAASSCLGWAAVPTGSCAPSFLTWAPPPAPSLPGPSCCPCGAPAPDPEGGRDPPALLCYLSFAAGVPPAALETPVLQELGKEGGRPDHRMEISKRPRCFYSEFPILSELPKGRRMLFSLKCLLLKAHFQPGASELLEGSCVSQTAVVWALGCRSGQWSQRDRQVRTGVGRALSRRMRPRVSVSGFLPEWHRPQEPGPRMAQTHGHGSRAQTSAQGPQPQRHGHSEPDSFLRWGLPCAPG